MARAEGARITRGVRGEYARARGWARDWRGKDARSPPKVLAASRARAGKFLRISGPPERGAELALRAGNFWRPPFVPGGGRKFLLGAGAPQEISCKGPRRRPVIPSGAARGLGA